MAKKREDAITAARAERSRAEQSEERKEKSTAAAATERYRSGGREGAAERRAESGEGAHQQITNRNGVAIDGSKEARTEREAQVSARACQLQHGERRSPSRSSSSPLVRSAVHLLALSTCIARLCLLRLAADSSAVASGVRCAASPSAPRRAIVGASSPPSPR